MAGTLKGGRKAAATNKLRYAINLGMAKIFIGRMVPRGRNQ